MSHLTQLMRWRSGHHNWALLVASAIGNPSIVVAVAAESKDYCDELRERVALTA